MLGEAIIDVSHENVNRRFPHTIFQAQPLSHGYSASQILVAQKIVTERRVIEHEHVNAHTPQIFKICELRAKNNNLPSGGPFTVENNADDPSTRGWS